MSGGMRRSIWGPVAVCVLALVASAVLPDADVRTWSEPVAASRVPVASTPVRSTSGLFAPSWPAAAFRHRRAAGSALFAPSWPAFAFRRATASTPGAIVPNGARVPPRAGWIAREQLLLRVRTVVSVVLAAAVALLVALWPRRNRRRAASLREPARRTVVQLAERGVAQSRISAQVRMPRDAVRVLLREAAQAPLRRRG